MSSRVFAVALRAASRRAIVAARPSIARPVSSALKQTAVKVRLTLGTLIASLSMYTDSLPRCVFNRLFLLRFAATRR